MPGMLGRVLRLGFNVSAVVSALLCVAVCVFWVRSYFARDELSRVWWPIAGAGLVEHGETLVTGRGDVEWDQEFVGFPNANFATTWRSRMLKGNPSREGLRWVRWPAGVSRFLAEWGPGVDPRDEDPTATWFHNRALGVEWYHLTWSTTHRRGYWRYLVIPYRLPFLLLTVLPLVWLYRRRTPAARRRPGHCPACGYDLRASPGRCPECGTAQTPARSR